jgi:hypothetical protein
MIGPLALLPESIFKGLLPLEGTLHLGSPDHPQDDEQDYGADNGRNDRGNEPGADADAESAGQPPANQRTNNTYDDVTYETVAATLDQ